MIGKDTWNTLKTTYEGTNLVKDSKVNILTYKFKMFKMQEQEFIEDMFNRFTTIVNELNALVERHTTH